DGAMVRLIPMNMGHVPDLAAIGLDQRLWSSTTIRVTTVAEMEAYVRSALAAQDAGTALPFVIQDQATRAIIGTTRFHSLVPEHRRVEIGFTWVAAAWQRKKVNTETKYLLLKHAFESMRCIRVEFHADSENEVSRQA